MSWEAVTWASKQKLKKSYEQIVLLVLANCADPNGEAFAKWPGRDHWWIYLSERTRLPKSSLFRHLNTLVALGLGERSMQVLADGSRRPTFTLKMDASFDIDLPEDYERYQAAFAKGSSENRSPVGTEHDEAFEADENDSDISHSQDAEIPAPRQSPVGTGNPPSQSPVGTDPFPVLRLQEDSLPVPKDSPLPPSGGLPVRDELWEQFVASWGEPIPKMALAHGAWLHAETAKRAEIVQAAKGYWAWLKAHPKPPSAQSAQSFIRDVVGWAQWLRWAPASGVVPSIASSFARDSTEGRALIAMHDFAGCGDGFRKIYVRSDGVSYRMPMTPQIMVFAQVPDRSEWRPLTREMAGAWEGLFREVVTIQVRTRLKAGDLAPWPWPASAEGKIYTWETGPPDAGLRDEELANFK